MVSVTVQQPRLFRGTVWQVDPAGRDLIIRSGHEVRTFVVPLECAVFVYGERMRLRFLQPEDDVAVTCTRQGEQAMPVSICVASPPGLPGLFV